MLQINSLYNLDCMEGMKHIPDKQFELAIVDVPYGIGESGEKNGSRGNRAIAKEYKPFHGGDKEPPGKDYFRELKRVSKNQIIWGANHFISRLTDNTDSSCWLIWDKQNGSSDFADCELAWTSFQSAVRLFFLSGRGCYKAI